MLDSDWLILNLPLQQLLPVSVSLSYSVRRFRVCSLYWRGVVQGWGLLQRKSAFVLTFDLDPHPCHIRLPHTLQFCVEIRQTRVCWPVFVLSCARKGQQRARALQTAGFGTQHLHGNGRSCCRGARSIPTRGVLSAEGRHRRCAKPRRLLRQTFTFLLLYPRKSSELRLDEILREERVPDPAPDPASTRNSEIQL